MALIDTEDTSLRRKEQVEQNYVRLYDPPKDGATPLDGEGKPCASKIHATDVDYKLGRGFTREPVEKKDDKKQFTPQSVPRP